jgi:hypothetical protein
MIARRVDCLFGGLFAALLLVSPAARAQDKKDKLELDKIPKAVMDGLKAKFPKAEIHKWTKEKEGDDVVYDIEFKQGGRKCEADIKEDGTILNFEKEIAAKDLPEAARKAVEKKYAKATLKEIMEVTEVKGKVERLEGYEVVLETADKKEVEVTVAADGRILEDSGEQQEKKDKLDLDKIPKAVMDGLKAKFPKAEIHKWTKEKEGNDVVYDIEFKQGGRKCEADIKEDGTILNFEKEIAAKDLPEAARKAVEKRYPKATLKEIMEVTEVEGKAERLEGYEVVLETADKKEVEITVAADGKVLEDSGDKKEEKK